MLGLTAIVGAILWQAASVAPAEARTYRNAAAYCAAVGTIDKPDHRYTGPAVPDWIARALMRATGARPSADLSFFKRAAWRCDNGRVLACSYGADIPCDQRANVSRTPSAAVQEYCRENPGSDIVPAVATGHSDIFEWRCNALTPVIVRQALRVDRRGFPTAFWYPVSPPRSPETSPPGKPPVAAAPEAAPPAGGEASHPDVK